jgi:hypothetical protein
MLRRKFVGTFEGHGLILFSGAMTSIIPKMGFPLSRFSGNVFFWALVSLHRRIVLGYGIPNEHLACWMWQYGQHLLKILDTGDKTPRKFVYDDKALGGYKKSYPKAVFSFRQLGRWLLNRNLVANGRSIMEPAAMWDASIDAMIQYRIKKTSENYKKFSEKMAAVQKLPF